ncbi:putative G-protein coupled receptor CG31760 [Arctopsyche grandis]|uniref:putative G-protein coupled receptor CG31760 n=1 Tax=Arctopsyche grandis TaxID=121162 RepID=UPI00406D8FDC
MIARSLDKEVERAITARAFVISRPTSNEDVDVAEAYPQPELPWLPSMLSNLTEDPPSGYHSHWSVPYYSCAASRWLLSYSVIIPASTESGNNVVLSLDLDLSSLEVNQCEASNSTVDDNQILVFHGSHKCSNLTTQCEYRAGKGAGGGAGAGGGWARGAYVCRCRQGFYSPTHPDGFNGSLVEVAWQEHIDPDGSDGWSALRCLPCAEGCLSCTSPRPCRASYNWPFRSVLLGISAWCAACTAFLAGYLHRHRRARVFRSASPVFLAITLLGCAIMYLEMAAIFPVLDTYTCIATKWSRHLGFCITYTALLMKTWRVSLTYRVKSAHAVKLTEQQLLRWLLPVLLIALVYLGTWTLSDPPHAIDITDSEGLKFKQCAYNWWDHSLAIGELAFLLWGVKVCYGVRHAESLYNEARLISYAIYNIAVVNCLMLTFHLLIFPQVGPDMKYFLGFIRTQLSTSVTVALVFGPKVVRVWRGFGDQWDSRAARGVSASFSLNGIGFHPHTPPPPTPHDLAQENDELKEEVQKLAAQIEFMKIVQMELHNRHLRPRPGGHFTLPVPPNILPQPQVDVY